MIGHASVSVSDPAASKAFYEAALAPLGYRVVMEFGPVTGLGGPTPGAPEDAPVHADLWLAPAENPTPCHIAVTASSTAQVDAFHEAALAAGGTDNGGPGERPHYHPGYYGAFVLDPDGNNLEAVFHGAATELRLRASPLLREPAVGDLSSRPGTLLYGGDVRRRWGRWGLVVDAPLVGGVSCVWYWGWSGCAS